MSRGRFAIIGGGRWAFEIAKTLQEILPPGDRLLAFSESNPARWSETTSTIEVESSMDSICGNKHIKAAFVARDARKHASTTLQLLAAGKSVFVEKPFALSTAEAKSVVDAIPSGSICVAGLVFLYAKNISNFFSAAKELGPIRSIRIRWGDPEHDVRRGQIKRFNTSLSVVEDVFPHIWSILRMINSKAPITIHTATLSQSGDEAHIGLSIGETESDITLSRRGIRRERAIDLFHANGTASLDFSSEPGVARLNGELCSIAEGFESPLKLQLSHFIRAVEFGEATGLSDVRVSIDLIRLTEQCLNVAGVKGSRPRSD